MSTSFEAANAAADRVAINAIVVEAADATADRVAIPVPLCMIARGPLSKVQKKEFQIENRRIFPEHQKLRRQVRSPWGCFIRQSPEDLSIPNVPKGYSLLVRTEGDATFARELLRDNDIILGFVNLKIGPGESVDGDQTKWSYVFEQLWKLANDDLLVPMFLSRGAAWSGSSSERTRLLMRSNPVFRSFIDEIYAKFDVCSFWVLANESGDHPWHQCRFGGGQAFRNMVTFGSESKVMWFRCLETKREFGISLPHSALVCIGKHAAGVTSGIQHRVTGGANSWLVVFENK
jgi:hypothetical protein